MKIILKLRVLDFASKLQKAGIENAFQDVRTDEQFEKAWKKFWKQKNNRQLKQKIEVWGEDFAMLKPGKIFFKNQHPDNPLEIVAIIYLLGDVRISENELFEDKSDLIWSIDRIKTKFAELIAETIRNQNILSANHLANI